MLEPRVQTVAALIAWSGTERLPASRWALEAALRRLVTDAPSGELDETVVGWQSPSPMGPVFPCLDRVVWALAADGLLVATRRIGGGCYVIDPWRRDGVLAEGVALPPRQRDRLREAGRYLASLCATQSTPSKAAASAK